MAREREFWNYVVQRVVIRPVLVLGILVFGFFLVEDVVWRWDLTEDDRYSISEASHELAASLDAPLTIRAYFSDKIPEQIRPFQRQVFDILDEYRAHSGGKIKVERYDPLESTKAQSEASNYGVRPIQLQVYEATEASKLTVFGGLVLVYKDRASPVINIAERYPQGYEGLSVLEYEISSAIWELTHEKPKIGLTGNLERRAAPANPFGGMPPQPRPDFTGLRQILGEAFEIEDVDLKEEAPDPETLPLLLVVRPREMTEAEVFRLDQYLMRGGRILMFITQGLIDQAQWGRQEFTYEPFKTGLDEWLAHHGLRVPNEFVLQLGNAVPIYKEANIGGLRVQQPVENWFWPVFGADALDDENPAVKTLKVVSLWWPHPVDVLENRLAEGVQATVLVRSHENESWRWKDTNRIDRRYLDARTDGPTASDLVSSAVAVALEGTFRSFFAEKAVPPSLAESSEGGEPGEGGGEPAADEGGEPAEDGGGSEESEGEAESEPEGEGAAAKGPAVIEQSREPTQLVVVGNSFFVSNAFLGRGDDRAREASLLAFNLADWLARSKELIALRAKRYADRSLVDEAFDERIEAAAERLQSGEIDEEEFRDELELARERQKARWKRDRWINVLVPCFVILLAGAIVWIVRAARRGVPPHIPAPVPPASVHEGSSR